MKTIAVLSVLAAFAIALSCSDDPTSPTGTLPIVQNLVIIEDSCGGQTVFLSWDAVDVEDLDGYEVWYATTDPGDWGIAFNVNAPDTFGVHVPTQTGHYTVVARKGMDTSSDYSNEVNTLAIRNYDTYQLRTDGNTGLIFGETAASTGDATSPDYHQDIYVAEADSLIYVYAGNHDPATYPGGASTLLAPNTNGTNVAPEPGSTDWVDSVQVSNWDNIFVMLDSGYYVEFQVADTVYTTGFNIDAYEYQAIHTLRLFNVFF
jgi:hypothetical protein